MIGCSNMKNILLTLTLLIISTIAYAETYSDTAVAVIVSKNSELSGMTQKDIVDMYTGKTLVLTDNKAPIPMDYRGMDALKAIFYKKLLGKNLSQINEYWAMIMFTGQATPPQAVVSPTVMTNSVAGNTTAVGYISAKDYSPKMGVKILMVLP